MNIILLEKINNLGNIGDEVIVKSGYARNYLVPQGKALYSTPENKAYFKEKSVSIKAENEKLKKEALIIAKNLNEKEVILIRAASEAGQLFGSVSTKDIVNFLNNNDFNILKNQVDLNKSIKNLTFEKVKINLHPEVYCEIILNVARSNEEADTQKKLGKAITAKENVESETSKNLTHNNDVLPKNNQDNTQELKTSEDGNEIEVDNTEVEATEKFNIEKSQ